MTMLKVVLGASAPNLNDLGEQLQRACDRGIERIMDTLDAADQGADRETSGTVNGVASGAGLPSGSGV